MARLYLSRPRHSCLSRLLTGNKSANKKLQGGKEGKSEEGTGKYHGEKQKVQTTKKGEVITRRTLGRLVNC